MDVPRPGLPTTITFHRRPVQPRRFGSVFALPQRMRTKAASVSESATAVTRPVTEAGTRSADLVPHVLVADGDAATRAAREAQLRAAGLRVSVARTGFEAIVKASCQVPDLILLDDSLSDIETAETARLLRTCPVTAHIAIVRLAHGRRVPRRVLSGLMRPAF